MIRKTFWFAVNRLFQTVVFAVKFRNLSGISLICGISLISLICIRYSWEKKGCSNNWFTVWYSKNVICCYHIFHGMYKLKTMGEWYIFYKELVQLTIIHNQNKRSVNICTSDVNPRLCWAISKYIAKFWYGYALGQV